MKNFGSILALIAFSAGVVSARAVPNENQVHSRATVPYANVELESRGQEIAARKSNVDKEAANAAADEEEEEEDEADEDDLVAKKESKKDKAAADAAADEAEAKQDAADEAELAASPDAKADDKKGKGAKAADPAAGELVAADPAAGKLQRLQVVCAANSYSRKCHRWRKSC